RGVAGQHGLVDRLAGGVGQRIGAAAEPGGRRVARRVEDEERGGAERGDHHEAPEDQAEAGEAGRAHAKSSTPGVAISECMEWSVAGPLAAGLPTSSCSSTVPARSKVSVTGRL